MAPTSIEAHCAACGTAASKVCQGCLDGIDNVGASAPRTLYCSVQCQKKDWDGHRATCKQLKARKQLYHAGDFIQTLFYAFRQHSFEVPLRKIEVLGDQIHIYPAHGQSDISDQWKGALRDTNTKKAVLAWCNWPVSGASSDAMLYMGSNIKHALKGISETIQAARVVMKPGCPLAVHYHYNRDGAEHIQAVNFANQALQVTLKHGAGVFSIDLSGAQHGYFDTVVPWDAYVNERIASVAEYHEPKEITPKEPIQIGLNLWLESNEALIQQKEEMIPNLLEICLEKAWEQEKIKLSVLLQLPEKVFQQEKRIIVQHVNAMLSGYIEGCRKDIAKHNKCTQLPPRLRDRSIHFSRISKVRTEGQKAGDQSMRHAMDRFLGNVAFVVPVRY